MCKWRLRHVLTPTGRTLAKEPRDAKGWTFTERVTGAAMEWQKVMMTVVCQMRWSPQVTQPVDIPARPCANYIIETNRARQEPCAGASHFTPPQPRGTSAKAGGDERMADRDEAGRFQPGHGLPGPGRQSLYDPSMNEQARKLALLGLTDGEIAEFFGVDESTINNWKISHPAFSSRSMRARPSPMPKLPTASIAAQWGGRIHRTPRERRRRGIRGHSPHAERSQRSGCGKALADQPPTASVA